MPQPATAASSAERAIVDAANLTPIERHSVGMLLASDIPQAELTNARRRLQGDVNRVEGGSYSGTVDALQLNRDLRGAIAANDRTRTRQILADVGGRVSTINLVLPRLDSRELQVLVSHATGTPHLGQLAAYMSEQNRPGPLAPLFPADVHVLRAALKERPDYLKAFNQRYIQF